MLRVDRNDDGRGNGSTSHIKCEGLGSNPRAIKRGEGSCPGNGSKVLTPTHRPSSWPEFEGRSHTKRSTNFGVRSPTFRGSRTTDTSVGVNPTAPTNFDATEQGPSSFRPASGEVSGERQREMAEPTARDTCESAFKKPRLIYGWLFGESVGRWKRSQTPKPPAQVRLTAAQPPFFIGNESSSSLGHLRQGPPLL